MTMEQERWYDQLDWEASQAAKPAAQREAEARAAQALQSRERAALDRNCIWWTSEICERLERVGFCRQGNTQYNYRHGQGARSFGAIQRFVKSLTNDEILSGERADWQERSRSDRQLWAGDSVADICGNQGLQALAREMHMCQSPLARAIDDPFEGAGGVLARERAARALMKAGEGFASDRERWVVATKALTRADELGLTLATMGLDKEAAHELCANALEAALGASRFIGRADANTQLAGALLAAGFEPEREGDTYAGRSLASHFKEASKFLTALRVGAQACELSAAMDLAEQVKPKRARSGAKALRGSLPRL